MGTAKVRLFGEVFDLLQQPICIGQFLGREYLALEPIKLFVHNQRDLAIKKVSRFLRLLFHSTKLYIFFLNYKSNGGHILVKGQEFFAYLAIDVEF
jgi:hypothetical protein